MLLKKSNGLVTILSSTNNAIITVAKSILDEAKIEYCITDGHDGKNSNSLAPPIEIQVKDANLNKARNLLADLEELNFEE